MPLKKLNKFAMAGVIWALAWPTMLEQLMQTAVQYIDTAMVGVLGTDAVAAVGSTTSVNWLIGSSISAISIGFLSQIAQAFGADDEERAKKLSAQAVTVTLVIGLFFTALTLSLSGVIPAMMQVDEKIRILSGQYFFILYTPMLFRAATTVFSTVLRAAGDTKTPMKVGIAVNITNIVLNFFFIYETRQVSLFGATFKVFGFGFGVLGAAAASAIAFALGGILLTVALFKHKEISPAKNSFKPDLKLLAPCFKISVPNFFQRFGTSLGYVVFAAMVNSVGPTAMAAHTVANTVESLFYIPGYGMQTAAATLAGNAYGAGDNKRLKSLCKMLIPIEIGLMIISGAALFFTARPLVSLFSDSAEVINLGTVVLKMVALSEPFFGFTIVVEGMMQGIGNTKPPFVYNILTMWGIRIVGTFICTQLLGLGLVSAWGCMVAHNLTLCALFLISFISGRWNPMNKKAN